MHAIAKRILSGVVLSTTLFAASMLPGVVFAEDMTISSGEFSGVEGHSVSGAVSIVKTDAGYEIVMGDDFEFDGAPDPKVALGKDGEYDPSTLIQLLKSNSGAQSYMVPDSIDVTQFNEVHIWCEQYSVGLGVAPLN